MIRACLALLLALALWPSAAAASPRAPDGGPDEVRRTTVEYAHGAARSPGGLELLRGFQTRLSTGSAHGCSRGLSDGPSDPTHPLSGHERLALRVRPLPPGAPDGAERACTPLCERLPYHATAPPSSR